MKSRYVVGIFALFCLCACTGCWDNVELNDRHIVLDMGIDKGEGENYKVTYSIPDVAKLSGSESLGEEVKSTLSVESPTLARSIFEMEDRTQNTISLSHLKAVLLGKELMSNSRLFKMAMESLQENMEVGQGTYLLAVEGKAEEIVGAEHYENPIIGLYTMQYFNNEERASGSYEVQTLGEFIKSIQETGIGILPIITENKEEATLKIAGGTLIQDYQWAGLLTPEDMQAKLLLQGKVHRVPIVVQTKDNYYTYEMARENCEVYYTEEGEELSIEVNLATEGKLIEYGVELTEEEGRDVMLQAINHFVKEACYEQLTEGIKHAQSLNIDFLGISQDLYKKHPQLYKKYGPKWEQHLFEGARINIHVTSKIEGFGMV